MSDPSTVSSTFDDLVATWHRMRPRSPEADTFYEQHIFPGVFARFQPSAAPHQQRYRALILVGSGQPDTAALLIAGLNPERVAYLLTATTRDFRARVRQRLDGLSFTTALRCPPDDWLPIGDPPAQEQPDMYRDLHSDHASVLHTYRGVRLVLEAWTDLPRSAIAIDLTGGKSTMTVGLAMSAHVLGIQSIYVESDYAGNQVVQGSQRLALTDDPYRVFGDLEAAEGRRLFNAHDYLGARRIFADLAPRLTAAASEHFDLLTPLADAYAAWDAFDLPTAHAQLDGLLARLERAGWPLLGALTDRLRMQHDALACLTSAHVTLNSTPFDLLSTDLAATLALLGSLHANALRREAQGRFDVAALLLYRCLELTSQRRLALLGIDADKERRGLIKSFAQLQSRQDPLIWSPKGTPSPPLLERIRQTTAARNKSLLAHGFRLIRKDEEYVPFKAVVETVLDRFYQAEQVEQQTGLTRAGWHAQYAFVTLEEADATRDWR